MNSAIEKNKTHHGFEFRSLIIQDRLVPIVAYNSKLVVYPSRFILFCIQERNYSSRIAKRNLKVIVKFIDYLKKCLSGTGATPDDIIVEASIENITMFLRTQNRALRKDVQKLLLDFFLWLLDSEQILTANKQADFLKCLPLNISNDN